jgi:hypothetical protein
MLDKLLRERLSQNEYRAYNALLILTALWLLYGMFDHSGLPGWLEYIQATYLFDGRYYPMLSFIVSFAFVLLPLGGIFLIYAKIKSPEVNEDPETE